MNVYVQYKNARQNKGKYSVFSVILTNQGVYIVDDEEESFSQDPEDRLRL